MARDERTERWINNNPDINIPETLDSGTVSVDSSGGSLSTGTATVSGANQTDSLDINAWIDSNSGNVASGSHFSQGTGASGTGDDDIVAYLRHDPDGNGWEVIVRAVANATTGSVTIGFEVLRQ